MSHCGPECEFVGIERFAVERVLVQHSDEGVSAGVVSQCKSLLLVG